MVPYEHRKTCGKVKSIGNWLKQKQIWPVISIQSVSQSMLMIDDGLQDKTLSSGIWLKLRQHDSNCHLPKYYLLELKKWTTYPTLQRVNKFKVQCEIQVHLKPKGTHHLQGLQIITNAHKSRVCVCELWMKLPQPPSDKQNNLPLPLQHFGAVNRNGVLNLAVKKLFASKSASQASSQNRTIEADQ